MEKPTIKNGTRIKIINCIIMPNRFQELLPIGLIGVEACAAILRWFAMQSVSQAEQLLLMLPF